MCRATCSNTTAMANRTRVISNNGIWLPRPEFCVAPNSAGDLSLMQPRRCPRPAYAIKLHAMPVCRGAYDTNAIEEESMRRTSVTAWSGIGLGLLAAAPALGADAAAGKTVFRQQCSICHTAEPG